MTSADTTTISVRERIGRRPVAGGVEVAVVGAGTEPGMFGGRERVYTVEGPGEFFRGTYTREEATRFAVDLYRPTLPRRRAPGAGQWGGGMTTHHCPTCGHLATRHVTPTNDLNWREA